MSDPVIGSDVKLEDGTKIGKYCVIGHATKKSSTGKDLTEASPKAEKFLTADGVLIGKNSFVRSHSVVYSNVSTGENFKTGHNVLIREHTTIGNDVTVGSGAVVDGYVKIGNKSQVQSNCYVCQTVSIGNGVFIAPSVSFYDNKKIILTVEEDLSGAHVEDYVRIGGGSVILPGIKIGKYSVIGAGSVVTKDIPEKSLAYGNPARVVRKLNEEEIKSYVDSVERQ